MSIKRKNNISKKNKRKAICLLNNSKGQAVLEYVLLTVMVLIILLGLLKGISDSTQKFAQNYFGQYFECLLDLGELPSLGADNSPDTECDDLYVPFTVADGRSLKSDFGNGANGSNGSGDSDNDSQGDGADDSKNSNSKSGSGETASSGASGGGGGVASGNGGIDEGFGGRARKVPLSNGDKKGAGNNADGIDGAPSGTNNFQQDSSTGQGESGRTRYVPIYGTLGPEEEDLRKTGTVKADVQKNPEEQLRAKRVPVSVAKAITDGDAKDESMTFPDIIKFLIITAIIIIIFVFFGGQIMQFNKSRD